MLAGTDKGMRQTFGSTCHGAGRAQSRNKTRRTLAYEDVLANLDKKGISIRIASPKLVMEEAPEAYKDVTSVVAGRHLQGKEFFSCGRSILIRALFFVISFLVRRVFTPIPRAISNKVDKIAVKLGVLRGRSPTTLSLPAV